MTGDYPSSAGYINLKMLQDAYAETLKPPKHFTVCSIATNQEHPQMKELIEKIYGK